MATGAIHTPANTSGVSYRTVLHTATHTPPSPHQLQSYEHLRVLGEHCYHRRAGTRAGRSSTRLYCVRHGARP